MSSMKNYILSIALALLTATTLSAQPMQSRHEGGERMSGGDFAQFQTSLITRQLALDEDKAKQFTDLYNEYSQKMRELQPKARRKGGNGGNGGDANRPHAGGAGDNRGAGERPMPSDEQVEAQILESFTLAEKSNNLKREYYYKFKEILTPQQILKMYNVERRLRERMLSESDRRTSDDPANAGGPRPTRREQH